MDGLDEVFVVFEDKLDLAIRDSAVPNERNDAFRHRDFRKPVEDLDDVLGFETD